MGKAVMISVNQPYSRWLVDYIKKIEWRKVCLPNCRTFVYETKKKGGCGKVIGEIAVGSSYYLDVNTIPGNLIYDGMVSRDLLQKYSKGKLLAANFIDFAIKYENPEELSKFGLKRPPQSWCYVEEMK